MTKPTCSQDGCANEAAKKKILCWDHHIEAMRERLGITPIPKVGTRDRMINRFWANVEKGPSCWGWKGKLMHGYGRVNGTVAHRLSYEMAYGPIAEGMFIDHLCHNRACTNPEHLREVTPRQNTQHRNGKNPNNTSGAHGVHWRKDIGKYQATVHCMGKLHHVGYFTDLDEAAEAARLKRNELFTHNDKDRNAA